MQLEGGEARNLSSSVGPCRISAISSTPWRGRQSGVYFPVGKPRHRGWVPLPRAQCSASRILAWSRMHRAHRQGRTSCLCPDWPGEALMRASPGAHAGIRWSSRRHPLGSRRHPLELCSNAYCAFLWRHHGLEPGTWLHPRCTGGLPGGG